jgi:hypothetical protein
LQNETSTNAKAVAGIALVVGPAQHGPVRDDRREHADAQTVYRVPGPRITFDDVARAEEAKEELKQV